MATSIDTHVHLVADVSKARALVAVLGPLVFPFILAFAIARSGHSFWDYPNLIASGQLTLFRQGAMWVGLVVFITVYVPPALTALASRNYLASTADQLVTPSGERFDLAKVKAISVRKTFWHKELAIQLAEETRSIVVTFARRNASDIREALKADTNLRDIPIT